ELQHRGRLLLFFFFFQAEDGIRDFHVTGVQTCALPIFYDEEAMVDISAERLDRYFLRRGRSYEVVPDLRQMVVFAPHNVIKDPRSEERRVGKECRSRWSGE